LTDN
jgi:hypothetical protein